MRRQAEPKDMLSKRYQQFQRRLARHYLNNMDEDTHTHADGVNPGTQTDRTVGGEGRQGAGGGENRPDGGDRERRPLAGLAVSNGDTADRRTNSTSRAVSTSSTVRAVSTSSSNTVRAVSTSSTVRAPVPNATFQIFSDQRQAEENVHPVLTENPNWQILSTQATKKKENEGVKILHKK